MSTERMFPVIFPYDRASRVELRKLGFPRRVPWRLLAPHEARAKRSHSQSLEHLAERGGLSPGEMLAVLRDIDCFELRMTDVEAAPHVLEAIAQLAPLGKDTP